MTWWLWILIGLGLLGLEIATPGGFVAFFFGIGALLVGVLAALGWAGPPGLQWVLFSAFSLVALALLRKPLQARLATKGSGRAVDTLIGETAIALDDIPVGEIGKAELRGSAWNAKNAGPGAVARGKRVKVEKVDGLMLWVHPE